MWKARFEIINREANRVVCLSPLPYLQVGTLVDIDNNSFFCCLNNFGVQTLFGFSIFPTTPVTTCLTLVKSYKQVNQNINETRIYLNIKDKINTSS